MIFKIDRNRYEITGLSFVGLPAEANRPDVPPDNKVTFTVEVKEDLIDDLRRSLANPQGFQCEFAFGEYRFKVRDARLAEWLPERDYGTHRLQIVFECQRQHILEAVRPTGRPLEPDQHADVFLSQVHLLSQEKDRIRRGRLQLASAQEEIDAHRAKIDEAERALAIRKDQLLATGTPELIAMAVGRGL